MYICVYVSMLVYAIQVCESGEGKGNPLQYSCLENPMDRGACGLQSIGITKRQTRLGNFYIPIYIHIHVDICIFIHIYAHAHIYTCIYIYICHKKFIINMKSRSNVLKMHNLLSLLTIYQDYIANYM